MYRIPNMFDRLFYYFSSEEESCPIVLTLDLSFTIDAGILKKAVNQALKRNGAFRPLLLIAPDGCPVYIDNPEEAEVYPCDASSGYFGTKEMNGYLFRVMYAGNRLVISAFHSLTDGRGLLVFARTVLYYYIHYSGHPIKAGSYVITSETPVDPAEMTAPETLCVRTAAASPSWLKDMPMFRIPEEDYPLDSPVHTRRFRYVVDTEALLNLAHESHSTFLSVLSVMVAGTIRNMYHPRDSVITMFGVVDLKPYYCPRILSNFAEVFKVPFTERVLSLDIRSQAHVVRKALIEPWLRKENLDRLMREAVKTREEFCNVPVTDPGKLRSFRESFWNDRRFFGSFCISNVGVSGMDGPMSRYVLAADMFIPASTRHPFFTVLSHGGRSSITLTQRFKNDTFARKLLQTFQSHSIPVRFADCGTFAGDKLFFSKIRRLS